MKGVFLANRKVDGKVMTLITYNKGRDWDFLRPPSSDMNGKPTNCQPVSPPRPTQLHGIGHGWAHGEGCKALGFRTQVCGPGWQPCHLMLACPLVWNHCPNRRLLSVPPLQGPGWTYVFPGASRGARGQMGTGRPLQPAAGTSGPSHCPESGPGQHHAQGRGGRERCLQSAASSPDWSYVVAERPAPVDVCV